MERSGRGGARAALLCIVLVTLSACEDTIVNNNSLRGENKAPSIVGMGPAFAGNALETELFLESLYVIVADPNGVEDISAVFLDIGEIVLNNVIARRDASTDPPNNCTHRPLYVDNDVLSIMPALRTSFPGSVYDPARIGRIFLTGGNDGVFYTPRLTVDTGGGGFGGSLLLDVQQACGTCTPSQVCASFSFDNFVVNPPTLPAPTEAFVTLVDVTLVDVKVTVYDAAGLSANANFPDLRVTYTTPEEATTLP
jgi:hypothetical protein